VPRVPAAVPRSRPRRHRVADAGHRRHVFRIGSITKTFTAIAVLQLWEQGLVDLDAPANTYLRAFRIVSNEPGWRQATVRHLLTHTAGLPELARPLHAIRSGWFSETSPPGRRVPSLAEFYRGRLRLTAEPGTTFTYTNHTFAALGQIVEDVAGQPLDRYLREHIFAPLGMTDSDLAPPERLRGRLATGYKLRCTGPRARDRARAHHRSGRLDPLDAEGHGPLRSCSRPPTTAPRWWRSPTAPATPSCGCRRSPPRCWAR
jgi:CubicO group peptidase (beta-lactamase class C family)